MRLAQREIVGHADGGDAGREQRLVRHARHRFSVHEDTGPVGAKRFPVIGSRHQHDSLLFIILNSVRFFNIVKITVNQDSELKWSKTGRAAVRPSAGTSGSSFSM